MSKPSLEKNSNHTIHPVTGWTRGGGVHTFPEGISLKVSNCATGIQTHFKARVHLVSDYAMGTLPIFQKARSDPGV